MHIAFNMSCNDVFTDCVLLYITNNGVEHVCILVLLNIITHLNSLSIVKKIYI